VNAPTRPVGEVPPAPPEFEAEGRSRDALLLAMTFASGSVDAVSFLGLGRIFTANMTGNIIFLALAIGQRNLAIALNSIIALVGFSVGAIFAGRLLGHVKPPTAWPSRTTALLYGHFACMAAFAVGWVIQAGYPAGAALYVLIALSSYGMGLQNAVARHLAVPGLSTTVVTMALTGFMMDLPALGIAGAGQRRALLAVIFLFSGAAVGGTLMVFARMTPPILTASLLGAVAVVATFRFGRRGGHTS
jgi:uncharacterized membrane protein YoaK (UPF0700 family)